MKISVVAIVMAAVAGISAAPMPNGQVSPTPLPTISTHMQRPAAYIPSKVPALTLHRPVESLEARASDAISSFMGFFRRDAGVMIEKKAVAPRKKVDVRVVGRAFSFPIQDAGEGGGN